MSIYGTQRLKKSFRLLLAMYVSLSKSIQLASSQIHTCNEGASIFFQHRAIALLVWTSPKSRSLVVFNVHADSCGYIPSIQTLALNGKLALHMSDRHLTTSFQKIWILEHSHRQWISVPFSLKNFVHISGILGDIWWNFSGVTYILINHLYRSMLSLVLMVCFWALKKALFHSISFMSSWISILHAFNFSTVDRLLSSTSKL